MRVRSQSPATSCSKSDPLAPQGAALPFLPTLVTALALGGFGLLCRAPAPPEAKPAAPTALASRMIEAPVVAAATLPALPGVEAFGRQYPLTVTEAAPRASRMAAVGRHRASHPAAGPAQPVEPAATGSTSSTASAPSAPWPPQRRPNESEDWLTFEALPFAPTAAALLDGVRGVGSRAVSLGGSVADLIATD